MSIFSKVFPYSFVAGIRTHLGTIHQSKAAVLLTLDRGPYTVGMQTSALDA